MVFVGLSIIAAAMVLDVVPGDEDAVDPTVASAAKTSTRAHLPEAATIYPSFDVVRINRQGGAVMAGRATPRAEIAILDGGREIGRVTADRRGEWVFLPDQPLLAGGRELGLRAVNPDGTSLDGREPVILAVPREEDKDAPALAVKLTPERGDIVLQGPPAGPAAVQALAVAAVTNLGNEGLYLLGQAPGGATIRLYLNGANIGTSKADGDGRWRLAAKQPVTAGKHLLRVDQMDLTGAVSDSVEVTVDAAFGPPVAGIVVQPGEDSWRIVRRRSAKDKIFDYAILYEDDSGRRSEEPAAAGR